MARWTGLAAYSCGGSRGLRRAIAHLSRVPVSALAGHRRLGGMLGNACAWRKRQNKTESQPQHFSTT